jgi:hypothetical protein
MPAAAPAAPAIPAAPAVAPPAPTPSPASQWPGGKKPDCNRICGHFSEIFRGSETVKKTILGQCVQRCDDPSQEAFRRCAWKAKEVSDIGTCNNIR